jgi:4-alpha-glucanotransferase
MMLGFPDFRIDFTESGQQDSVTLKPVHYLPDANLAGNIAQAYKTDFLAFMNFIFIVVSEMQNNAKDLMALANETIAKFAGVTNMAPTDTPLERLKKNFLFMQQKQETEKKYAEAAFTGKALILFNATNNSTSLVDDQVDTKHTDVEMELTKGIIKIKVVHDPIKN